MKYYIIYKITNKINGKIYIGKHQTKNLDDGYMGSGIFLNRAIEKYGQENFTKEILFQFDNEAAMNAKEAELVTEDFVKKDANYNLCPGGKGSFSYINKNNLGNTENLKNKKSIKMKEYWTEERKKKKSLDMIDYYILNGTEKVTAGLKKRYSDEEFKNNFDAKMNDINKNSEKRKKAGVAIKEKWNNDEEFKQKMKNRKRGSNSNTMKEKWKDPEFRKMMLDKRKKDKV